MGRAAASARRSKDARPAAYCENARCLWRIVVRGGPLGWTVKPCPRHPNSEVHLDAAWKTAHANVEAERERAAYRVKPYSYPRSGRYVDDGHGCVVFDPDA